MSSRTIAIAAVVLVVVLCLVAALGALAYYYFMVPTAEAEEAGPMILIDSPSHGDEVTVGEVVQVFATGRDPNRIARVELWVDGGMVQSQASALPDGTNPFPLMTIWVPETPGNHTIVVRGYNTNDVPGQASVAVNGVEAVPPVLPEGCQGVDLFDHQVQMGETLEGIAAGYELTAEEILACNPGLDPAAPLTPGDVLHIPAVVTPEEEGPPADFEPPPVETPPDVPPEEELPGEELPPPEEEPPPGEEAPPEVAEPPEGPEPPDPPEVLPTVTLAFEALELEADQAYDNVYCMVWLADADMEQVPETGSFAPVVDNYWDIQAELAGMNSVPVPVTGDIFRVEVECFGWSGIDGWSLGHFVREHSEAEWTGDEIEVTAIADDGRWFRVVYRICPDYPCEPRPVPPAPENLVQTTSCPCAFPLSCPADCPFADALGWDWTGDEAAIDGFRLYRNDTMLFEEPDPSARVMPLPPEYFDPPCGEEWNYHLTAYKGPPGVGVESDPSNTVTLTGPACPLSVVVTWETLYAGCIKMDLCPAYPPCDTCRVPNFHMWAWANGELLERAPIWGPPFMQSYSELPMDDLMHLGDASVTVELDPADNLSLGLAAVDWDPGPTYSLLLLGGRTLTPAQVVTGDYWFLANAPVGPWPWDAFGFVKVHLEVTP